MQVELETTRDDHLDSVRAPAALMPAEVAPRTSWRDKSLLRLCAWFLVSGWGLPVVMADWIADRLVVHQNIDPSNECLAAVLWSLGNLDLHMEWRRMFWLALYPYLSLLCGLAIWRFAKLKIVAGLWLIILVETYITAGLFVCNYAGLS